MGNRESIAILGAGRGQVGLARAAKDLGLNVVAVTMDGGALPALEYADRVVNADISDPDAVSSALEAIDIQGAATSCLDMGMRSLGRLCDGKGLTGPSEASAERCNNKTSMKLALVQAGVPTAEFRVVHDLEELASASNELQFPVVAKAVDLNGSMGIGVCKDKDALLSAYSYISEISAAGEMIVEEFLVGTEVGAQAMVSGGEVVFVLPHGDQMHPDFQTVPIGHTAPLNLDESALAEIRTVTELAIGAIGLNNCAVNIDLMLTENGVKVIELTGRVGANGLPELLSEWFDVDYYEVVVKLAMGEDIRSLLDRRAEGVKAVGVRMLTPKGASGVLESISFDPKSVKSFSFFVEPGSVVQPFENSSHCIGQAVATGASLDKVNGALGDFEDSLVIKAGSN